MTLLLLHGSNDRGYVFGATMSLESFILGAVAVFAVMKIRQLLSKSGISTLDEFIERAVRFFSSERRTGAATPEAIAAEPQIEIMLPDYGNIRPIRGEEQDPEEFGPDIHEFPEMKPPITRFEDFNRRLFIVHVVSETKDHWPNTTADDFPTRITGMTLDAVKSEIQLRLRPRYPVILDTFGYWAHASAQLEQEPDYTNDVVAPYLALPHDQRPVVVSVTARQPTPSLTFMRYGFADFPVSQGDTRFFLNPCLTYLMTALFAPREEWLWLSVARMRQAVIRAIQANEAKRREGEATQYMAQKVEARRKQAEHENRFVRLWRPRIAIAPAELPAPEAVAPSAEAVQ